MLRKVLKDYREGFRWSRFKETYHYTMLWWYMYMFCFFPIILDLNEKVEKLGGYYLVIIPLLFGMYSVAAIPIRLPKQMFLCPLTMEERKKYVSLLFWVRYIGTVLPGIIAYGIAVLLGWIPVEFLPVQILGLLAAVFCASITSWPGSTWERDEKKKNKFKTPELKGLYPISVIGLLMAIFLQCFEPFELFETVTKGTWIFLGIYSTIVLVLVALLSRYIKPVLKMTTVYEYSYDVAKKEPKKA